MIPDAIEEMMRAYAAVTTFRTCVNPVTLGEVTFQPGDKIAMPTCLAGRDPEYYEVANKVILNRKARYLSFGYGPHRSEEHTSELQSLMRISYAVFCLKKK